MVKKKDEIGRKLCSLHWKKNGLRNLEVFVLKIYATEIGLQRSPSILICSCPRDIFGCSS